MKSEIHRSHPYAEIYQKSIKIPKKIDQNNLKNYKKNSINGNNKIYIPSKTRLFTLSNNPKINQKTMYQNFVYQLNLFPSFYPQASFNHKPFSILNLCVSFILYTYTSIRNDYPSNLLHYTYSVRKPAVLK